MRAPILYQSSQLLCCVAADTVCWVWGPERHGPGPNRGRELYTAYGEFETFVPSFHVGEAVFH